MTEMTHEAIAQLRADVADLRFALGCEREALGKAIADYINLQAEVTAIRAENDRLRKQVEADAVVRQAAVDALAEAGCSGAGLQEHVGDAIRQIQTLRAEHERLRESGGAALLRELRGTVKRHLDADRATRDRAERDGRDDEHSDMSIAIAVRETVLRQIDELIARAAKEAGLEPPPRRQEPPQP